MKGAVLSYPVLNEASRDVGGSVTVVQINTGPSPRIYINNPCYVTYFTLKPVFRMVCECSASGEHIVKSGLSLKGNQTKKNEMSGKCGAYKVSVGIPEGKNTTSKVYAEIVFFFYFCCGAATQRGSWPPHS